MEKAMGAPWRARWYYGRQELGDRWEWQEAEDEHGEIVVEGTCGWHPRSLWFYVRHALKWLADWLVELTCNYGESIPRVLGSLLLVYVLFTLIYGLTWSVMRVYETPAALIKEPTRNLVDLARFSLGAMTTMGPAGLEPRNGLVELVTGLEALLGIALTGLLGFVLGNRIRRS